MSIVVEARNPQRAYEKLIREVARENVSSTTARVTVRIGGGGTVKIGQVGFTPGRWVRYCDHYLEGGAKFERFLERGGKWDFANHAGHDDGACLRWIKLEDGVVRVNSREVQLAPTGVLDFKMLGIVASRTGLPVKWEIDVLKCEKKALISARYLISRLVGDCGWADVFWKSFERNKDTKYGRLRAMYREPRTGSEETIARSFVFCVRRDFTWLLGVQVRRNGRRVADRDWKNGDSSVSRVLTPWRRGEWIWNEIDDSMKAAFEDYFGVKVPVIERMATVRARRLSLLEKSG